GKHSAPRSRPRRRVGRVFEAHRRHLAKPLPVGLEDSAHPTCLLMYVDLNCDLGEGFPHDAELMPLITSANVACGYHAGDLMTAQVTLRLAARHGVQVGAHPGYADR